MSRGRMLFKLGVILLIAVTGVVVFMAPVRQVSTPGTPEGFGGPLALPVVLIALAGLLVAAGMARMILARRGYARRGAAPRKRKNVLDEEIHRAFDELLDSANLDGTGTIPLADDELPELSEDDLFVSEEKPKRSGNQN